MQPIGLTLKLTNKKYGPGQGELMLVHLCVECGGLSINRVAADDDSQKIMVIYESSYCLDIALRNRLAIGGIHPLEAMDCDTVCVQLFGSRFE